MQFVCELYTRYCINKSRAVDTKTEHVLAILADKQNLLFLVQNLKTWIFVISKLCYPYLVQNTILFDLAVITRPTFSQAPKGLQMGEFNNRHPGLITYSSICDAKTISVYILMIFTKLTESHLFVFAI